MEQLHSLLARQIKRYLKSNEPIAPEWQPFIDAVNDAYWSSDNDRKMLEHSLDLSSQEMFEVNRELKTNENTLRNMLANLQKTHDELKQAQIQLLQSEKLASIGQLAAGIAHEINNPIGFINSNLQTLEQYWGHYFRFLHLVEELKEAVSGHNLEKANAIVKKIGEFTKEVNLSFMVSDVDNLIRESRTGMERIRKIILDLRTFARADTDTMELSKVEVIIDSILSIIYSELKYKAELKKTYGETPMVRCNQQKLGQVFLNLLVNAVQAMEQKGTIEIKTYRQNDCVCVDVSDTGSGIEKENLTKVFDAFFTTKPVGKGTGLGLSVSYDIVKKHGGDIKVKSEVGKGTTFTVMLPLEKKNA